MKLAALTLLALLAGCVHIGAADPPPKLSDDPAAGPAACWSECTVLAGCTSKCGYVSQ